MHFTSKDIFNQLIRTIDAMQNFLDSSLDDKLSIEELEETITRFTEDHRLLTECLDDCEEEREIPPQQIKRGRDKLLVAAFLLKSIEAELRLEKEANKK